MARVVKVKLTAEVAEYATAMQDAANKTRTVGTEAERLTQKREAFQQLGAGLMVVGGAMTALSVAVMKTGIEYNTLQQTSRAALTTLLGSAEAANAQMDKLDEFARTSPFSKAVFISAQQQMLAFGIEAKKVVPYLDAIQDAVAAAGGSNADIEGLVATMSKIQSSAKITAQDLMEFGNRGVDAAGLIGQSMGKTGAQIREEITAGSLDATAALDALVKGMATRFDGAAENVKQTFAGAMDRVQAAWRDFSAELAAPLVDPNGGGALVDLLNWAADAMRAFQELPGPVKTTTGAMFAFTGVVALLSGSALVMTPRVIAMKNAFLALSGTMRGIAIAGGAATAALTIVVAVVAAVASAQAAARQRAEDYAAALRQGTEATNEYVAAQLAAEDSYLWFNMGNAIDNAKELGITVEELTAAVNGTDAEFEAFKQRVIDTGFESGMTGGKLNQLVGKVDELRVAHVAAEKQIADTEAAQEALTGSTGDATTATREQAQAAEEAAKALDAMKSALDEVAGSAMSMSEANDAALSSINDLVSAAEVEGATLDGTNEASIKLRDSLRDVEKAHRDSAAAILENGGTLADATTEWDKGRDAVIRMLVAKGLDREEAIRWADQNLGSAAEVTASINDVYQAWLNLPENKETKYKVEKAQADAALDALKQKLDGIPSYRRITLEGFTVGNFDVSPNADGGIYHGGVKAFAAGGFEPGIYPYTPGGIHKFAEEYSEAYISGDPARRARSEAVWLRAGREFGFSQPQVNVAAPSLDGLSITGRLEIGGDGLARIIDGRIVKSMPSAGAVRSEFGPR